MDHLNSPNGQNYLVVDPGSDKMALTEQRSGSDGQTDLEFLDSVGVYVFKDWLGIKGMVSPIGFEGNDLLYSHVFFDKGVYYGLVMKLLKDSQERIPVSIPYFVNKAPIQSGCLSADKKYLILSAESNDSHGVEDLYVSIRGSDGSWSSLKNLGLKINSAYQEVTPFLAADNKTLFFASNRPGGAGSFDIYFSRRLDDYWKNWSDPELLTDHINTSGSETSFAFRAEEGWAYFIRSKDSDGYGDVYKVKMQEGIEADTISEAKNEYQSEEDLDSKRIQFEVADAKSGRLLPATLITPTGSVSDSSGRFNFSLGDLFAMDVTAGSKVEFKSEGYLPKILEIADKMPLKTSISLASIAKGETVQLQNVLFRRGTADLMPGSEKELDLVVEVMNDNPKIKILLKGHTDNTGDPVRNVRLSEARVKSVKEYIISRGVSPYRVSGKGFGGNQPIASNENEETRKLNRRVEFEVVDE